MTSLIFYKTPWSFSINDLRIRYPSLSKFSGPRVEVLMPLMRVLYSEASDLLGSSVGEKVGITDCTRLGSSGGGSGNPLWEQHGFVTNGRLTLLIYQEFDSRKDESGAIERFAGISVGISSVTTRFSKEETDEANKCVWNVITNHWGKMRLAALKTQAVKKYYLACNKEYQSADRVAFYEL